MLAAKLCGKAAPAGAADVLSRLGLGAPRAAGPGGRPPAPAPVRPPARRRPGGPRDADPDARRRRPAAARRAPTASTTTATARPTGRTRAARTRSDATENRRGRGVRGVRDELRAWHGRRPDRDRRRHQRAAGQFSKAEIEVAPGVAVVQPPTTATSATVLRSGRRTPSLRGRRRDRVDMTLHAQGRRSTAPRRRRSRSTGATARSPSCRSRSATARRCRRPRRSATTARTTTATA